MLLKIDISGSYSDVKKHAKQRCELMSQLNGGCGRHPPRAGSERSRGILGRLYRSRPRRPGRVFGGNVLVLMDKLSGNKFRLRQGAGNGGGSPRTMARGDFPPPPPDASRWPGRC